jgi:hypothetical protein
MRQIIVVTGASSGIGVDPGGLGATVLPGTTRCRAAPTPAARARPPASLIAGGSARSTATTARCGTLLGANTRSRL